MNLPQESRSIASYTTRLDQTLKILEERVKQQEQLLEELRASTAPVESTPSADLRIEIHQILSLKAVYEDLKPKQLWLPGPDSPLSALLAIQSTDKCIKGTQDSIQQTQADLEDTRQRLAKESAFLDDSRTIQADIRTRILVLQSQIDDRTQKPQSQVAKDMLRELEAKENYYNEETRRLVKAFQTFINDHLAPMLAAEELGGPIVGDDLGVDETMLEAGFNAQGRAKKPKNLPSEDKRQQRIDQIWGSKPQSGDMAEAEQTWDEKDAAGAEMRDLTEQLLNRLVEAGGTGPGAYVELTRESAAARFLVRSKVAQFHPRDARKLRLVDFGGEVED
ncbi:hypothetical protein GLAREA_00733 [Glarea lozoyensis ATCC 20868]|uniref:Centromere-associated protein K n=1 Tax=Glarea lozoyensis (strain ATCC 20868 / MF5171) TaxID=1116229 RepID=S3DT12_GLAL2|nr:uncharacterized protein GLAREA_00733 [Glarea lozoyensis ATCC 20868]EPE29573.1 hypothetical protein GLAREA_00733 [Glarea lozoyensis ATCC 20868]